VHINFFDTFGARFMVCKISVYFSIHCLYFEIISAHPP